jgi:hypothetical protein
MVKLGQRAASRCHCKKKSPHGVDADAIALRQVLYRLVAPGVSCRVKTIFDAFAERSGSAAVSRNKKCHVISQSLIDVRKVRGCAHPSPMLDN